MRAQAWIEMSEAFKSTLPVHQTHSKSAGSYLSIREGNHRLGPVKLR